MTEINRITHWHAPATLGAMYEKLLDASRINAFGPAVLDATTQLTAGVQRLYLFEATSHEQNQLQYHFCERYVEKLFPTYSKCYLRQDPISEAYSAAAVHSDMVLQRVRPRDIHSAGLRRQFFDAAGIVERISIVQRGQHAWRGMSLARHQRQGYFSEDELNNLLGLAFLALPLLSRTQDSRQSGPLSITQLETRFADSFPQLTSRERQVCARAVAGMTVDATAEELGIGRTSVLTYRQRAYLRLNVKSSLELSALVVH
jgi:DNA-binding CsgD family transcriptional regulator